MSAEEIRRLFGYNSWANTLVFDALERIPPEAYAADAKSSHGGMHGTMAHIVYAQHLWLLRWRGLPHDAAFRDSSAAGTAGALRSYWLDVERETGAFLDARLNDAFLRETFTMKTTKGESFTHSYAEAMLHAANHGCYHRGQIATLMRQAGYAPPPTDYIVYIRQLQAGGAQ